MDMCRWSPIISHHINNSNNTNVLCILCWWHRHLLGGSSDRCEIDYMRKSFFDGFGSWSYWWIGEKFIWLGNQFQTVYSGMDEWITWRLKDLLPKGLSAKLLSVRQRQLTLSMCANDVGVYQGRVCFITYYGTWFNCCWCWYCGC